MYSFIFDCGYNWCFYLGYCYCIIGELIDMVKLKPIKNKFGKVVGMKKERRNYTHGRKSKPTYNYERIW